MQRATMIESLNLFVAWIAILLGLLVGVGIGLFFEDEGWLGGYASWQRRLLRLGHVALFGTGFLNLAFVLTARHLGLDPWPLLPSVLFVVGAVTMPTVCFLAAWRRPFVRLFFIPVLSLIGGTVNLIWKGMLS